MPPEIPERALEVRRRLDAAEPLVPSTYGSAAELMPFRSRHVLGLRLEAAAAELLKLVLEGSLTPLEYAHSALLMSTGFSVDPRVALAGVGIQEGVLVVQAAPRPYRISRRALLRYVRFMNALAEGLGAAWSADPDYVEEMSRSILAFCGGFDRAALAGLLGVMKFRLEPRGGIGPANFLCGYLRRGRPPVVRMSLPGAAFSASCADLGLEGVVAFSSELPKAVNYLIGSGDVVELVSGSGDVARRRAVLLRDLRGPEAGPEGPTSLGALVLDCSDPFLRRASKGIALVRVRPGAYDVNPSVGAHVLFPSVEGERVDLNVRACPVCGSVTYSTRCPVCGSVTEPARICPSCKAVTKSEVCGRCGVPTVKTRGFRVSFSREISRFRGAEGLVGEEDFPGGAHEDLMKGVLRLRHGLRVYCDGTTRVAAVLLRSRRSDACSLVLPFKSARALFEVSRFVDEVASRVFSSDPPYGLSSYRDLKGVDVIVLKRGGNVGYVAKVSGFVDAPYGFSGSALPRGEVSLILPLDLAWNASYELAEARAGRCAWGVPTALVNCGSGGEARAPDTVLVESGLAAGATAAEARAALQRVLERNVSILSSLGASREVCNEIREALEDLVKLYASPEVVCESCGRRFRRPTISGVCPRCGGRLRPTAEEPDAESLRALSDAVEGVCGPSAAITVDALVRKERQARLTDFL